MEDFILKTITNPAIIFLIPAYSISSHNCRPPTGTFTQEQETKVKI